MPQDLATDPLVASPDEVVRYRPMICAHCQQSLEGVAGQIKERAPLSITCRRYACSCESTRCRKCVAQRESLVSRGSDPLGGEAPVQYGPKIRALAVYLHEYQLVPLAQVRAKSTPTARPRGVTPEAGPPTSV